jgi:hypothetical protein
MTQSSTGIQRAGKRRGTVLLRLANLLIMAFYEAGDRRRVGCFFRAVGVAIGNIAEALRLQHGPGPMIVMWTSWQQQHYTSVPDQAGLQIHCTRFLSAPSPPQVVPPYTMSSPSKTGTICAGEFDHLPDALAVHVTSAIQDYHTLSGDERSKHVAEHCRVLKSSMRAAEIKVAGDFLSVRIFTAVSIIFLTVSMIQAFKAHVAASARPPKHKECPLYCGKAYTWQDTFKHMWWSEIAGKAAELSGSRPGSAQFIARYKDATKEVKDSLSQDDKAQVAQTHERWNKFSLDPDVQAK